ncbi:MAG: hypothetical protein JSU92_08065 [Deltaproteobacteria bacterium]|nr:MAG: hypothetical protein JSU92_08065 [Deltaproteobacteria bacterium]
MKIIKNKKFFEWHGLKKDMKYFLILFLIAPALGIIAAIISTTIYNRDSSSAVDVIEKFYPGYALIEVDELDSYAKDYFKKDYPNKSPSLIHSDFDGNGFLDFAFLLRNKKSKDAKTIFTIFLQSKKNKFNLAYYLNLEIYRDDVYIVPIEPGVLVSEVECCGDDDKPTKKIHLKNTAVELFYVGKASVAFYWDSKKNYFDTIATSD